jgi:hypothetical protein
VNPEERSQPNLRHANFGRIFRAKNAREMQFGIRIAF